MSNIIEIKDFDAPELDLYARLSEVKIEEIKLDFGNRYGK